LFCPIFCLNYNSVKLLNAITSHSIEIHHISIQTQGRNFSSEAATVTDYI